MEEGNKVILSILGVVIIIALVIILGRNIVDTECPECEVCGEELPEGIVNKVFPVLDPMTIEDSDYLLKYSSFIRGANPISVSGQSIPLTSVDFSIYPSVDLDLTFYLDETYNDILSLNYNSELELYIFVATYELSSITITFDFDKYG